MSAALFGFGLTPHEIYEQLTGGPGSEPLDLAQGATRSEWEREEERAQQIRKLGEKIRIGWQGEASDAAFGAARPLAEAALQGADQLGTAQDLLSRQSGSFHDAANNVRPVPPGPPENNILNEMIPFETDLDREIKAYQADAQHNLNVYQGYDNESQYNETNMPREYTTIAHSGGTITVKDAGGDPEGDSAGDTERDGSPRAAEPGRSGGPGPGGGATGGSPVSEPPPGGGSGGGQTSPSEVRPSTGSAIPGAPPTQSPAAQQQIPALPGGFVGGPTGGVAGGSGGGRGGSFAGTSGPGRGGSGGPGGGSGRGVSAGPGALAAEETAARRGVVPGGIGRGAAAGMPVAPMGGGRGQGDEDEEHQPKIMIESGGEEIFGTDVLTAPQVIGDDEYED